MNKTGFQIIAAVCILFCVSKTAFSDNRSGPHIAALAEENGSPVLEQTDKRISRGDLVGIRFTASLQNGEVFLTNRAEADKDQTIIKSDWYEPYQDFHLEQIIAGKDALLPGLANAVVGLARGERRTVTFSPGEAFGFEDPNKMKQFPKSKKVPLSIRMSPRDYVEKYNAFPIADKLVDVGPYLKARVASIDETVAVLEVLAQDGQKIEEEFGSVEIKTTDKDVEVLLHPTPGAPFELEGRAGRVSSADSSAFTVDFNHPVLGKAVVVDFEINTLTKTDAFKEMTLPWIEDHDKALENSQEQEKPSVLVLYADWCSFCKRVFSETFSDPRILQLKDQFVWARVDSDINSEFKEMYNQNGFPLIMVLDGKGGILKRIDGFVDARKFSFELMRLGGIS
ncbi:MAG: thioredoxin family protein [Desulfobulbaceae bacterium]|nr:thioredoxin family protein [Desulfobulbaceae bacterium]